MTSITVSSDEPLSALALKKRYYFWQEICFDIKETMSIKGVEVLQTASLTVRQSSGLNDAVSEEERLGCSLKKQAPEFFSFNSTIMTRLILALLTLTT